MNSKIELVWVNRADLDMGLQIQEHSHICYQLYYVMQGDPIFVIDKIQLQTHPHTLFYIPPNTAHYMLPLSSGTMHAYDLKFIIHDAFIRNNLPATPTLIADDTLAEKMLTFIVRNWEYKDQQNLELLENLLSSLLSCFYLDQLCYDRGSGYGSHHIDTTNYNLVTRTVISYIEAHYSTPHFSLVQMAEDLNYNKNYLSTAFSKSTGISIVDYLNLIRIRKAIIFFALHNQDVFTTYESIGFTNPSHFSRVFKSLVGISPRKFKYALASADRQRLFLQEPLLNYRICSLEEAYASLRRIGTAAKELISGCEANAGIEAR